MSHITTFEDDDNYWDITIVGSTVAIVPSAGTGRARRTRAPQQQLQRRRRQQITILPGLIEYPLVVYIGAETEFAFPLELRISGWVKIVQRLSATVRIGRRVVGNLVLRSLIIDETRLKQRAKVNKLLALFKLQRLKEALQHDKK